MAGAVRHKIRVKPCKWMVMMRQKCRAREHAGRRRTIAAQRDGDQMDQANHQNLGVPPVPTGDTLLLYRIDLRASDNVYKKNWSIFVKKGTKCPFMPPATAMHEDGVNRSASSIEKHLSF